MANSLLTIDMITREAVRLFVNSNAFIMNIDRQYNDEFAVSGAKIGNSLRIRLPNDYTVRTGPAASVQDTAEQSTTLTLAYQQGVDISFSSQDRTLSLDDYSERVLLPAMNNLAGAVATTIMGGAENICNFTSNVDGSDNVISPTATTWLQAGAILNQNSAPMENRKIIMDPLTQARTVGSLTGLFNPQRTISEQYRKGEMSRDTLGFDWFMDQTVIAHTTAAYSTLGTVSGADQTGSSITVTALAGPLSMGDIITFEDVYAVNRVTKQSNATLRQFAVTADVDAGATSIPIYPALIPGVGGQAVQYQTVVSSPANGATIAVVTKASEVYRKNFAFAPQAVTMGNADLELPRGVHEASRSVYDDCSIRIITDYNVGTDQFITRTDFLYGYQWVRPEWACVVADAA